MREDNPIGSIFAKIADLVFLNMLILLGCLPIITIGASVTAGHFVALRIKRAEAKVFADFCRSYKENFKQATVIWLIFMAIAAGILAVLWFYGKERVFVSLAGLILLVLELLVSLWVYPVLSRFVNSTGNIIRNGAVLCFRHLFRTVVMLIGTLLPVLALVISLYSLPVIILCGLSLPVYISAQLYHRVFLPLEKEVEAHNE